MIEGATPINVEGFREAMRPLMEHGIARLFATDPNWLVPVKPWKLDMQRADRCVLGLWHGDYAEGRQRLGLAHGHDGGFTVMYGQCSDYGLLVEEGFLELQWMWRDRITALRSEAGLYNV
jgi:hypothetical protein